MAKVMEVAVDWGLTKAPVSSQNSAFEGTECDSSKCETLLGTLFLANRESFTMGGSNSERRFSDYAKMLAQLAQDSRLVASVFGRR